MLFAYLGPETLLPITSVIAAIAGGGLILGKRTVQIARAAVKVVLKACGLGPRGRSGRESRGASRLRVERREARLRRMGRPGRPRTSAAITGED